MMAKSAAIGIMCKAPQPGRAKTRLAASVGSDAAAQLAACFLRDMAAVIDSLPAQIGCRGYGIYAPVGGEAELRTLLPPGFKLLLQSDDQFGNVLFGAIRRLLGAGHDCAILVNSDSPTLPSAILSQAIEVLRKPGDRMVIGPASDGGYYLIGMKRPHAQIFSRVPWGSDRVAAVTLERASQMSLEAVCLPEWYDVDDAETLGWLQAELNGTSCRFTSGGPASSTRACLAQMGLVVP